MENKVGRRPVGGYGVETKIIGSVRLPVPVYNMIKESTSHVATWLKDVAITIYKYNTKKDKL